MRGFGGCLGFGAAAGSALGSKESSQRTQGVGRSHAADAGTPSVPGRKVDPGQKEGARLGKCPAGPGQSGCPVAKEEAGGRAAGRDRRAGWRAGRSRCTGNTAGSLRNRLAAQGGTGRLRAVERRRGLLAWGVPVQAQVSLAGEVSPGSCNQRVGAGGKVTGLKTSKHPPLVQNQAWATCQSL